MKKVKKGRQLRKKNIKLILLKIYTQIPSKDTCMHIYI